jgi:hypothetical protein
VFRLSRSQLQSESEGEKMTPEQLEKGTLVQLNPETCRNQIFAACIMTVFEPKSFGAQGYVQALGENGKPGGQAYYRAHWEGMEIVGKTEWEVE